MRKNCSSDRDKLLKFKAESREFAKKLRSLLRTICSNSERSEQSLVTECCFNLFSGGFTSLINYEEQLEFRLERNIGIQKHAGKIRK